MACFLSFHSTSMYQLPGRCLQQISEAAAPFSPMASFSFSCWKDLSVEVGTVLSLTQTESDAGSVIQNTPWSVDAHLGVLPMHISGVPFTTEQCLEGYKQAGPGSQLQSWVYPGLRDSRTL